MVGFEVLRADTNIYRYEPISREILTVEARRYYEVYSPLDGSDEAQSVLVSVSQQPLAEPLTSALVDFHGWLSEVRSTSRQFEVRFLTGAIDSSGRQIEARVVGPTEEAVRALVSTLSLGSSG